MLVKNHGTLVAHIVLASGPVDLKKGDTVEMPEWVYKMLLPIFPALVPVEEAIVEAEPAPIVEPKPAEVKNAKGKKSRK